MSMDDGFYSANDYWMEKALRDIEKEYRHRVSIARKHKNLLKFGRSEAIGTSRATVMDLPAGILHETLLSSNGIDTISSSSGSDTRQVKIEGHTLSGGDFTFVVQTATLTGQSKVVLTTPLARVSRMYADDTSEVELVGALYIYEDDTVTAGVPDTDVKVHLMTEAGSQQSHKAATTISSTDYWIVLDFDGDCYEKTTAVAEVRLEVRKSGGVFRPKETLAMSNGSHADHDFKPYLIICPNSDIRLTAVADGASTDVGGMIQGVLATIVS